MEKNFNLEIISPEKIILSEKVNSVTIPSFEGEMTILLDHIPLITFLRPGILRIEGSKESEYFVEEGTVEFSNNTLIVLSSTIIPLENVKGENISKMIEASKALLAKENLSDKAKYIASHKIDTLSKINQ
jgi:F-type H+-transporting ATPase subunit epsilon|tara:strand:+ start:1577 stop:1966 length:390 start_codon:yes stop_codon:yes gene_type:complete